MPERAYFNNIPSRQRIEVAFEPGELPGLLADLAKIPDLGHATAGLIRILQGAQLRFGPSPKEPTP